jgi:hypothetical protein
MKDRQRLTLPHVIAVPSALAVLTSLFGMGRGDPRRYSHLKISSPDHLSRLNVFDIAEKRVVSQLNYHSGFEQANSLDRFRCWGMALLQSHPH